MNINIICGKPKREDKYIKPFAKFYLSLHFPNIKEVNIDCPDKNNRQRAPDYFLIQPKIAVEIKEVHDEKETKKLNTINESVKRLREALNELNAKGQSLNATYLLQYPENLKIRKDMERDVAQKIIDAIKNNQSNFHINNVGNFKIVDKIVGIENKKTGVILINPIVVKWINSAETIHNNIKHRINKSNEQLGNVKANKKILLLVNKYLFGDSITEFIEAISYSYKNLLNYKNIDEIWLQVESADNQFHHWLLYEKDFLISLDKGNLKAATKDKIKLFGYWFYVLSERDEYKDKLFVTLKRFLEDKKPHEVFDEEVIREKMVQLGHWLAKKGRFNDVVWIIDKFIDDPDPNLDKPRFNYHQRIANGECLFEITTVLGNLAQVIKELATRKKYIAKALDYTEKLLSHENLYVKLQAISPLIQIASNRQWLQGWGEKPRKEQYEKFHKMVFDLVNLVKENPNYKAIAKWLCDVFTHYKDLSTKEAEQVLDVLKTTEESAKLFVYFCILRKRHYKNQTIKYNAEKLSEKLKEIIKSDKNDYLKLQENIAIYLYNVLKEKPYKFNTIQPYIELMLEQSHKNEIYVNYIIEIIKEFIEKKPDICTRWYDKVLSILLEYHKHRNDIYLAHTERIVESIAKHNPKELTKQIVEKLNLLYKKGAFVGNLNSLNRKI